jgi:O-antigen ligase/Tfp pilus assembly protein PilF
MFTPLLEGGTTHQAVMVIRLLILALVGLWLAGGIRTGTLPWASLQVGPVILAFLALGTVSALFSPYANQSWQWLIVLLGYGLLLFVLVSSIERWDHVFKLLTILIGVGVGEAAWALVQWGSGRAIRPSGTFFNPNFLAGYLAAVWVILLAFVCYQRRPGGWGTGSGRVRTVLLAGSLGVLALLLAAIFLTGSRGGMLATLAGTALVVGLRFGRKGIGLLLVLVLLGIAAPNPLRDRVLAEHAINPVSYARVQIWESSLRAMADHPFGVGLGLYQYVYPRYAQPVEGEITRYGKVAQNAHNEYLQMGVEMGLAGLLVFIWGVILVAREAARALQERLGRRQRIALVGASAALATVLTQAAVDANLHEPAITLLFTLCVGIVLSCRRLAGAAKGQIRSFPLRPRLVWAGLGALALVLAAVHVVRLGVAWTTFEAGSRAAADQDVRKAIADYAAAIELDRDKALYHSSLAAVYFRIYERTRDAAAAEAARAELRTAMELNPLDGRLPGLLGLVSASMAGSLPPNGPNAEASRARRATLLREAVQAYERAAELEPFSPFHRLEAGRVRLALGEPERAEMWARQAVELEPNFLPGREWLARFYLAAGRRGDAVREYQEIRERQKRYEGWAKDPVEERFLAVNAAELERMVLAGVGS